METSLEKLTPEEKDIVTNLKSTGLNDEADTVAKAFGTPISSNDIKTEPPFKVAEPPPATAGAGLTGSIESQQDDFTRMLEQQKKDAEASKDITQREYLASILGTQGETELTAREYERKGGVDTIQKELDDINQQIRQEQTALRRQIEKTQTTPGLTKGQVDARTSEIERVSLRKQADLSLIQLGIQGRYDSAKAIADRAVAVKMEQQKRVNDALKIQYEDNKELFNKAEQRQFESLLADRERKFAKQEADETAKYNAAIEAQKNGAPTSVVKAMLDSKTKEDALAAGGSYIGLLDRQLQQAQLAKIYSDMSATTEKPLTQAQYKALGFGNRMVESSNIIDKVGSQFTDSASRIFGSKFFPNFLKSDERQAFEQAKRNFINATLRQESGAAISPEEFISADLQYFPQPGDKPNVLLQKQINRDMVTKNMLLEAGQDTDFIDTRLNDPLGVSTPQQDPLGLGI